jgi:Fe(II)/alpha-ketoglutarate-dependent arginine beta-hydroxylase
MEGIQLSQSDIKSVKSLLSRITARYDSAEDPDFLKEAALYAHELPLRARACLNHFKLAEPASPACIISGYPVDQAKIGKTPDHWAGQVDAARTLEEEILLALFSSLLGDVFGWATQQDGHIIHDVMPIRDHRGEQIGTGSEQEITWHNEDAFHPCRGDYVAMMCMRNQDRVPTTMASIDSLGVDYEKLKVLFEPRFVIRPDYSHSKENNSAVDDVASTQQSAFNRMDKMLREPEKVAVLFGDRKSAYIRLDPFFMDPPDDQEARLALNTLTGLIDANLSEVVLEPGDICFIDNYKVVHGRKAFKARFDGTDRWLKRINITRDLRRSREFRATPLSRTVS